MSGGAIEDGDQLIDFPFSFLLIPRSNCIGNAVTHVVLEHKTLDTRQSCAHSLNLSDNVNAIAVVINHLYEPPDLSFDPGKPRACVLSSFWCHKVDYTPRGYYLYTRGGYFAPKDPSETEARHIRNSHSHPSSANRLGRVGRARRHIHHLRRV